MPRRLLTTGLAVVLALVAVGCGDDDDDGGSATGTGANRATITVGGTNFAEQDILAHIYAEALAAKGYRTSVKPLAEGTREIIFPALDKGDIDLIPEYVGSLLEYLEQGSASSDLAASVAKLRSLLEPKQLTALEPAKAFDANAVAVTEETAREHSLTKISDLANVDDQFVFGGPPECPTRPLCLLGLKDKYGLEFKEFKPLDVGGPLVRAALSNGSIQAGLVLSSDVPSGAVALEDDKALQPAENIIPVLRTDKVDDEVREVLNGIAEEMTNDELSELNRQVNEDKEDPADVAEAWLEEHDLL